uniref:Uncharacterized protein n=1 Tax=Xenorhabdus poinarii TaxID=40577 RepID=W8Y504_9GAMM|nr:hypothetical protein [Xenorhabdus poinarii]CDN33393.1 hypothetical protein [Xenorhabdus poinarii]
MTVIRMDMDNKFDELFF